MATVDTSIYQNLLRPVKSIADYDAEYEQAQANKLARMIQGQTMSMNKMTLDEKQRGLDEENQIRSIIQGLGAAPLPDVANALQQRGYLKQAMDIRDKVAAKAKTDAEISAKTAATAKDYAEMIKKGLGFVFANPSPEAANSTISILEQQTGKDLSQYRQQIAGFTTPEQFKDWAAGHTLDVDKMLPKFETQNLGGTSRISALNPVRQTATTVSETPITQSADNLATNTRQALADKDASARGWATIKETQRKNAAEEGTGSTPKVAFRETDAQGNVTFFDSKGNKINTVQGAGKPSATYERTQAAKAQTNRDLALAISELEKATKDGGLIDQSTGSGAGAIADNVAGFFGSSTKGAEAVGAMKPIFDLVLKMVPRFEGPQSDKDTQLYKEAAGELANPAIPNERKKRAAKEILRLMKKRQGQFIDKSMVGTEVDATPSQTKSGATVTDW